MDDNDNEDDDETNNNPYLALRKAKMARNEARLKELGLSKSPPLFRGGSKNKKKVDRKRRPTSTSALREVPPAAKRRSSRRISSQQLEQQQQQAEINNSNNNNRLNELPSNFKEAQLPIPSASASSERKEKLVTSTPTKERSQSSSSSSSPAKPPAPNSVRSISLHSELLVKGGQQNNRKNGDDGDGNNRSIIDSILGIPMDKAGKEYVIYESFERASIPIDYERLQSQRLSFNKYSGVQEWYNTVFLWVNLGAPKHPNTTIVNEFLLEGKQITWFGGSRMYEDSPIIQKLLDYGKNDVSSTAATSSSSSRKTAKDHAGSNNANNNERTIILWCRRYDTTLKRFLPYVCLGRLSYESHIPNSYPMQFIWNLLDYDSLAGQEEFQNLLNAAAGSAT